MPANLCAYTRRLLNDYGHLHARVWLKLETKSFWVSGRRIQARSEPPPARADERDRAIQGLRGSFLRVRGRPAAARSLVSHLELLAERDEIRHERDRLLAVWNDAVDAMIVIDEKGTVHRANPATERLFGYTPAELIGQNIAVIMPRPYREEHDDYLHRYVHTGRRKIIGIGRRVPGQRKDGHIFPAHLSVSETYIRGTRFFTGILRDISDVVEARTRAAVEERRHLSRELHDSVSQALFGIVLGTQAATQTVRNLPGQHVSLLESLAYVLSLAESGLSEMRALMFELRPESLEAEGLLVSLRRQAEALAKRYQLEPRFEMPTAEPGVSLTIKHEIYRFVMEALHNVVKHASASWFHLRLTTERGVLRAEVEDDGIGFNLDAVPGGHVGLQSMRERVASLGGQLVIDSQPGRGTRLLATMMQGEASA